MVHDEARRHQRLGGVRPDPRRKRGDSVRRRRRGGGTVLPGLFLSGDARSVTMMSLRPAQRCYIIRTPTGGRLPCAPRISRTIPRAAAALLIHDDDAGAGRGAAAMLAVAETQGE